MRLFERALKKNDFDLLSNNINKNKRRERSQLENGLI